MNRLVCDFCCSEDDGDEITWDYPAKTFTMAVSIPIPTIYTSNGHWGACVSCHRLIDDDKRDELALRSMAKFFSNAGFTLVGISGRPADVPDSMVDIMLKQIKELHDEFFKHRAGPCRLVKCSPIS